MQFYKIPLADLIVFYDELDLPPGKLRVKIGGGAGGHNGIRSIDQHVGSEYQRVRIGIGHPGLKHLVTGYVLGRPAMEEALVTDQLFTMITRHIALLVGGAADAFMSKCAGDMAALYAEDPVRVTPQKMSGPTETNSTL